MACMTLFAQTMAMATSELARVNHLEDASIWQIDSTVERKTLSMSWVVVTDHAGSRSLRMQWASAERVD
jgi:hypothetical protein